MSSNQPIAGDELNLSAAENDLLDSIWDEIDFDDTDDPILDMSGAPMPYVHSNLDENGMVQTAKSLASTTNDTRKKLTGLFGRGVRETIDKTAFEDEMLDLLAQQGTRTYLDGLRKGGVYDLDDDDKSQIEDFVVQQIDYVDSLSDEIYNEDLTEDAAKARVILWINKSVMPLYFMGLAKADADGMYQWRWNPLKEHCTDCERLNNQVHRMSDWLASGWLPQGDQIDCGGWRCGCKFVKVKLPEQGEY